MWSSSCIINDGTDEQYYYDCDTKPGNSGSAIYTTINSNQVIIGVHDGAMEDLNYGSILTSEKVVPELRSGKNHILKVQVYQLLSHSLGHNPCHNPC